MRPLRNTERVLNNKGVEKILQKEKELGLSRLYLDLLMSASGDAAS
jgi:nitronate monooxygenase